MQVLPTGYDPVRDAISDHAVGRHRGLYRGRLVAGGMACLGDALVLSGLHPSVPTFVVVMPTVNAAARFLLPSIPTHRAGSRFQTVKGTVHMVPAFLALGAVAAAATSLSGLITHDPEWNGAEGLIVTPGWLVLAGAVLCVPGLLGPRLQQIFGLIGRLFTVSVITWLAVISVELIRR